MARTLGVVFLTLTLIGFVRGRRELFDPNKAVLLFMTAAVVLAIWVRVSEIGNYERTLFLILVFVDAPFAALGAQGAIRGLERLGLDRGIAWLRPRRAATLFAACLLVAGWTEALLAHHTHRDTQARLGKWIATQAGQFQSVVADFNSVRPLMRRAEKCPTWSPSMSSSICGSIVTPPTWRSSIRPGSARNCFRIWWTAARLGLTPLDQKAFSSTKPEFVVFVRKPL